MLLPWNPPMKDMIVRGGQPGAVPMIELSSSSLVGGAPPL